MPSDHRVARYLVAIVIIGPHGERAGAELVTPVAYTIQDAIYQAATEVASRNSITERGMDVQIAWIGPFIEPLLEVARDAVNQFWLARMPVTATEKVQ